MANQKNYMVFKTQEEFTETFERIFAKGRAEGFKDGCVWVLSYVEELFKDLFKPETFERVEDEIRHRRIEQWRLEKNAESLKDRLDSKWRYIDDDDRE